MFDTLGLLILVPLGLLVLLSLAPFWAVWRGPRLLRWLRARTRAWMVYVILSSLALGLIAGLFSPAVHCKLHDCVDHGWNPIFVLQAGVGVLKTVVRVPLILVFTGPDGETDEVEAKPGTLLVILNPYQEEVEVWRAVEDPDTGEVDWRHRFTRPYPLTPSARWNEAENVAQLGPLVRGILTRCRRSCVRPRPNLARVMSDIRFYVHWHEDRLWMDWRPRWGALLGALCLLLFSVWYWPGVITTYLQLRREFPAPRQVPLSLWHCALAYSSEHYEQDYRARARQFVLAERAERQQEQEQEREEEREQGREAWRQARELRRAEPLAEPILSGRTLPTFTEAPRASQPPALRRKLSSLDASAPGEETTRRESPVSLDDWLARFLELCGEPEWPAEIEPRMVATLIVAGLLRPTKRAICVGERYRKERQLFRDVQNKLGPAFQASSYHLHVAWMLSEGLLVQPKSTTLSLAPHRPPSPLGQVLCQAWQQVAHEINRHQYR